MEQVIKKILEINRDLFLDDPIVKKIDVGFTNLVYDINDKYIVKICFAHDNEENFAREISFYLNNSNNVHIPKLYKYDLTEQYVPYHYEIIEKLHGRSLYEVWPNISLKEREKIISQICALMKEFHSERRGLINWQEYISSKYDHAFSKVRELFTTEELKMFEKMPRYFAKYLGVEEAHLIHNDLHFDNLFYCDEIVKVIDFERCLEAPIDFELDIFFRMVDKPWKFASEQTEKFVRKEDYAMIKKWVSKYYEEIVKREDLNERLAIYDIIYSLNSLFDYPHLKELKDDVLNRLSYLEKSYN